MVVGAWRLVFFYNKPVNSKIIIVTLLYVIRPVPATTLADEDPLLLGRMTFDH